MEVIANRLLLREFVDGDVSDFEKYNNDPRSLEFYGTEDAKPGHARALIAVFQAWSLEQPRLNYQLAIARRKEPQALIGCCGLRTADSEPGTAVFGIELAPDYWGRFGYAIEVMYALVEFGFDSLELEMIRGDTVRANSRVARLVSAFGAKAVENSRPTWSSAKAPSQVQWQLTKEQWGASRLTIRCSRHAETRA